MKITLSLSIVLFVVGSLTLIIALQLVAASYSFVSVVVTAAFVAWIASIPFLLIGMRNWNPDGCG